MRDVPFRVLNELAYEGNVGVHELMLFYKFGTDEEKDELERLFDEGDVKGALKVLEDVVGTKLIDDEEDEPALEAAPPELPKGSPPKQKDEYETAVSPEHWKERIAKIDTMFYGSKNKQKSKLIAQRARKRAISKADNPGPEFQPSSKVSAKSKRAARNAMKRAQEKEANNPAPTSGYVNQSYQHFMKNDEQLIWEAYDPAITDIINALKSNGFDVEALQYNPEELYSAIQQVTGFAPNMTTVITVAQRINEPTARRITGEAYIVNEELSVDDLSIAITTAVTQARGDYNQLNILIRALHYAYVDPEDEITIKRWKQAVDQYVNLLPSNLRPPEQTSQQVRINIITATVEAPIPRGPDWEEGIEGN
jgi:hypothetical protein